MRALIWKEAIQSPRVVEVEGFLMPREPLSDRDEPGFYDLRLSVTSSQVFQEIVDTCAESKRAFEKCSQEFILANKDNTLYIRNFTSLLRTLGHGRREAFDYKILVPSNIRNLAIDTRYSPYDESEIARRDNGWTRDPEPHKPLNVVRFLSMFQELKTLAIVMKTGSYEGAKPHPTEFMPGYIGMCVETPGYGVGNIWSVNQDQTERSKAYQEAHRLKAQLLKVARCPPGRLPIWNGFQDIDWNPQSIQTLSELSVRVVQWMKP